jgi:hypothetical protein
VRVRVFSKSEKLITSFQKFSYKVFSKSLSTRRPSGISYFIIISRKSVILYAEFKSKDLLHQGCGAVVSSGTTLPRKTDVHPAYTNAVCGVGK